MSGTGAGCPGLPVGQWAGATTGARGGSWVTAAAQRRRGLLTFSTMHVDTPGAGAGCPGLPVGFWGGVAAGAQGAQPTIAQRGKEAPQCGCKADGVGVALKGGGAALP
jgi:hypothetical protein